MEIKSNFVSSITLGNFNPAILTPNFLINICGFELKGQPKGRTTPVLSNINFEDISFLVDLERMQIVHRSIRDFGTTPVCGYLRKYLTILPYTPVFVSGINLNCDVIGFDFTSLKQIIIDENIIDKLLGINEYRLESKIIYKLGKENYLSYNISFQAEENICLMLTFNKNNDICIFNYNYEVRNLDKEKELLSKITDNLDCIIDNYKIIIQNIFGV